MVLVGSVYFHSDVYLTKVYVGIYVLRGEVPGAGEEKIRENQKGWSPVSIS